LIQSVETGRLSRTARLPSAQRATSSVQARETHNIASLTIWRRKLRGVEFAVRATQDSRANPLVGDSLLFACIWSPGAVVAVERQTGRQVWRRSLPPLAHDSVLLADDVLCTHNLRQLFALDPTSGQTAWTWHPPGDDQESLHGSPTVAGGRLFIGDQSGRFWCLDAASGDVLWVHESSPDTGTINCTPMVIHSLAVFATTDCFAVACDVRNGREVWRERLDGPVSGELLRFKGGIAVRTFWSAYVLDPRDGQVAHRFHWRGRYLRHLIAARDTLMVTTQRAQGTMSMEPYSVLGAAPAGEPSRLMIGLNGDGEVFRQPCPARLLALRWSPETGLIYESRGDGLGILDPRTGERMHDLVAPGSIWDSVYCGPVDVHERIIYMLDVRGNLRALEHPARKNVRSIASHRQKNSPDGLQG